jgi:hypothetical protein
MATPDQLFLLPELGPPPAPKVVEPKAVYGRYDTKSVRHACTRCVIVAYEAERAGRPIPALNAPHFRRQFGKQTDPEFAVRHLCEPHKQEAHAEDEAAGRLAKQAPVRRGTRVTA